MVCAPDSRESHPLIEVGNMDVDECVDEETNSKALSNESNFHMMNKTSGFMAYYRDGASSAEKLNTMLQKPKTAAGAAF